MKKLTSILLSTICLLVMAGCVGTKPLVMNTEGLYKFTDDAKPQYLLFLNKKNEWERTHKKVTPSTSMVIIYEEN